VDSVDVDVVATVVVAAEAAEINFFQSFPHSQLVFWNKKGTNYPAAATTTTTTSSSRRRK